MSVQVADHSKATPHRLPWPYAVWALPFILLGIEWSWWQVFADQLESAPAGLAMPASTVAALSVCGKLMAHGSEAAFYVLVWRARSSRLPFWRFLGFVIAFSVTDQLAYGLAAPFKDGGAPAWRVALAGLHLAAGTPFHDSPAIRAAFGSIGLLTALRIGLTAIPQARAAGRRLIGPLILTALVWLLTRIAAWWAFDLIRGMSPVGGG